MEIIAKIKEIQEKSSCLRAKNKEIGFVPTMGALHQGHISLIEKCKEGNDWTIVSIFVNSIQFNDQDDLNFYPRPLDEDLDICRRFKVDTVFIPSIKEMYPEDQLTFVNVNKLSTNLCGKYRPGHFQGVATVVTKLFNITKPHRAYFGLKDYQQVEIVKRLVKDLNFDLEIITLPTVRNEGNLALSSRNKDLTLEEQKRAVILSQSLRKAFSLLEKDVKDPKLIIKQMNSLINQEPLAEIEYIKICDPAYLTDLDYINKEALVALAVRFGKVRLIDNLVWKKEEHV
ncbi:pantoate--beta-alanine ligase [bacterium]|nr:pantoate--beta-alanine ligase [bacterium]